MGIVPYGILKKYTLRREQSSQTDGCADKANDMTLSLQRPNVPIIWPTANAARKQQGNCKATIDRPSPNQVTLHKRAPDTTPPTGGWCGNERHTGTNIECRRAYGHLKTSA